MTNATLVKRASAISSLSDSLQVQNGEMVATPALLDFMELALSLQSEIDSGWKAIKEFMLENKIDTTKGDWGYLTIGWTPQYKTTKELPPRFYKKQLNTNVVKLYQATHGSLPTGVTVNKVPKLSKGLK